MPAFGFGRSVRAIGPQVRPAVGRAGPPEPPLPAPADRQQGAVGAGQDARLDRGDGSAVVDRTDPRPGPAEVGGPLEVDPPAVVLGARPAEERAVGQGDRLVLDRAEDALRQPPGPRPGSGRRRRWPSASPTRPRASGRPCRRGGAGRSRPDRGPGSSRGGGAPRRLRRRTGRRRRPRPAPTTARPGSLRATQMPTSGLPLVGPAEPGRDERAVGRLGDRRGVAGREGRLLVEELPDHDRRGRASSSAGIAAATASGSRAASIMAGRSSPRGLGRSERTQHSGATGPTERAGPMRRGRRRAIMAGDRGISTAPLPPGSTDATRPNRIRPRLRPADRRPHPGGGRPPLRASLVLRDDEPPGRRERRSARRPDRAGRRRGLQRGRPRRLQVEHPRSRPRLLLLQLRTRRRGGRRGRGRDHPGGLPDRLLAPACSPTTRTWPRGSRSSTRRSSSATARPGSSPTRPPPSATATSRRPATTGSPSSASRTRPAR